MRKKPAHELGMFYSLKNLATTHTHNTLTHLSLYVFIYTCVLCKHNVGMAQAQNRGTPLHGADLDVLALNVHRPKTHLSQLALGPPRHPEDPS